MKTLNGIPLSDDSNINPQMNGKKNPPKPKNYKARKNASKQEILPRKKNIFYLSKKMKTSGARTRAMESPF